MTIILIGNYPPDRQESMERFTKMLERGFLNVGIQVEIWRPLALLGARFYSTNTGVGKWIGYIDKWLLFPLILKWRLLDKKYQQHTVRFHICDHSNAPYLACLPAKRTAITCHDVLAIRGALGYTDAYCPASGLGIYLQKWILHHLKQANSLAAVSYFTLNQLLALSSDSYQSNKKWTVIHNAFNAEFYPIKRNQSDGLLSRAGLKPDKPFILHVGSGLARKNRKLLLDMIAALGDRWRGFIYYAGQPLEKTLLAHAKKLGLQDRVVSIVKPSHELLIALYSSCEAFVFPSLSEGFGWPVIEAQACGAPVIASTLAPMPEVSGGAALHANPNEPAAFARALTSLIDKQLRADLIARGFQNIQRFEEHIMMDAYLQLHQLSDLKVQY